MIQGAERKCWRGGPPSRCHVVDLHVALLQVEIRPFFKRLIPIKIASMELVKGIEVKAPLQSSQHAKQTPKKRGDKKT